MNSEQIAHARQVLLGGGLHLSSEEERVITDMIQAVISLKMENTQLRANLQTYKRATRKFVAEVTL